MRWWPYRSWGQGGTRSNDLTGWKGPSHLGQLLCEDEGLELQHTLPFPHKSKKNSESEKKIVFTKEQNLMR